MWYQIIWQSCVSGCDSERIPGAPSFSLEDGFSVLDLLTNTFKEFFYSDFSVLVAAFKGCPS